MAQPKFKVNIQGGSGSIIMGDHTNVSITSARQNSERVEPSTVTIEKGVRKSNESVFVQETNQQKTSGIQETSVVYKITQGYALIIHNKNFEKTKDREGSENDMEAIREFCQLAGIKIHTTSKTEDLTATQMEELCDEISQRDFDRYDAFLCIILSHGKEEAIYGVDNNTISVQKIVSRFRDVRTLTNKPKLFFIQACRGTKQDYGVEADSHIVQDPNIKMRLPTDSDLLLAYSTVDGYESYRSPDAGSWFIITFMELLKQHAHNKHLMDILVLVNREIAKYITKDGRKQMPCQMSTLTKFIYFNIPPPQLSDLSSEN